MTDYLDTAGAAEHLGIAPGSVRRYRAGGNFPEPDRTFGQSPVWLPETLDQWQANRPGRTGRPKKENSMPSMATVDVPNDVHVMAYQELWGETFPGVVWPGIGQGGTLGWEMSMGRDLAMRWADALERAGYERKVWLHN